MRVANKKFKDEKLKQNYIKKTYEELSKIPNVKLLEPPKLLRQQAINECQNTVSDILSECSSHKFKPAKEKSNNSWILKLDDVEVSVRKPHYERVIFDDETSFLDNETINTSSTISNKVKNNINIEKSDDKQFKYKVLINDKTVYFGEYPTYYNVRQVAGERASKLMSVRIINKLVDSENIFSRDYWEKALHNFNFDSEMESLEHQKNEALHLI